MNKKAEDFKKYLETKAITCFTVEEIDDDQLNTVVFRSTPPGSCRRSSAWTWR